ncbi:uncharacterized protein LOC115232589 [Argonauta hians]
MDVNSVLCLLLVAGVIGGGLSISCYNCNSSPFQSGKYCMDIPEKYPYIVDCDIFEQNYTRCRKVVQNIDDEVRIIRQCAKSGGPLGCESRVGTKNIRMKYCHCDTDHCNSAPVSPPSVSTLLLCGVAGIVVVITRTMHNVF